MQPGLPAFALCALLCMGLADAALAAGPTPTATATPQAAAGPVALAGAAQAQTVRRGDADTVAVIVPSRQQAVAAAAAPKDSSDSEQRPAGALTLLAAVALMTGIALRRWGAGHE